MRNQIKEIREHFRLSQAEFCRKCNLAQSTISTLETTGATNFSAEIVVKINSRFGVSADIILGIASADKLHQAQPNFEAMQEKIYDYEKQLKFSYEKNLTLIERSKELEKQVDNLKGALKVVLL